MFLCETEQVTVLPLSGYIVALSSSPSQCFQTAGRPVELFSSDLICEVEPQGRLPDVVSLRLTIAPFGDDPFDRCWHGIIWVNPRTRMPGDTCLLCGCHLDRAVRVRVTFRH